MNDHRRQGRANPPHTAAMQWAKCSAAGVSGTSGWVSNNSSMSGGLSGQAAIATSPRVSGWPSSGSGTMLTPSEWRRMVSAASVSQHTTRVGGGTPAGANNALMPACAALPIGWVSTHSRDARARADGSASTGWPSRTTMRCAAVSNRQQPSELELVLADLAHVGGHHGEVQRSVAQPWQHPQHQPLDELKLYMAVALPEPLEGLAQCGERQDRRQRHPQQAVVAAVGLAQIVLRQCHLPADHPRPRQQAQTGVGEHHAAGPAYQQRRGSRLLEQAHRLGDGGLRQVQGPRRRTDAALVDDSQEHLQLLQLHAALSVTSILDIVRASVQSSPCTRRLLGQRDDNRRCSRQVQNDIQKALGQPQVVDNVGGVGGALGVQKMLGSTDGHTLLLGSPLGLIIPPLTIANVKYKPGDLRMVAQLVKAPMVLVARKDLPANNVEELLALAATRKDKPLTLANTGPGGMFHLVGEKFSQATGVEFVHVPYRGSAPAMGDLMGGQVDLMFTIFAGPIPATLADGKLKAIGLATARPLARFPQIGALGAHPKLAGFEFDSWAGVQVPRNMPEDVAQRLNKALYEVISQPQTRQAFENVGNIVVAPTSLADLDRLYQAEIARYQAIAKSINLQLQP